MISTWLTPCQALTCCIFYPFPEALPVNSLGVLQTRLKAPSSPAQLSKLLKAPMPLSVHHSIISCPSAKEHRVLQVSVDLTWPVAILNPIAWLILTFSRWRSINVSEVKPRSIAQQISIASRRMNANRSGGPTKRKTHVVHLGPGQRQKRHGVKELAYHELHLICR